MAKKYIVVIGDIVSSRDISNRVAFNRSFKKILKEVSVDNPNILSPYTITLGDEIQAVFQKANGIFRDAIIILASIYPRKMRFSFGIGNLSTPIIRGQALGMDGPAFHSARKGIESLKKSDDLFLVTGDALSDNPLIQPILDLISHNMSKWKPTRLKTLAIMLKGTTDRKVIARELKKSPKTIYKTMDAGALNTVHHLIQEVEEQLNDLLKRNPL